MPDSQRARLWLGFGLLVAAMVFVAGGLLLWQLSEADYSRQIERSQAQVRALRQQLVGDNQTPRAMAVPPEERRVLEREAQLVQGSLWVYTPGGDLFGPYGEAAGLKLESPPLRAELLEQRDDFVKRKLIGPQGQPYLLYGAPFFADGARYGVLVLATPVPETGPNSWLGSPLWIASGLALLVGLVLALLLGRLLTWPLSGLAGAADRIALGDYDQRVVERGPREVRRLAHSFNLMAERTGRAQRRQREFVARITQETRAPLGALQAEAALLAGHTPVTPAERQHAAQSIQQAGQRIERLVDNLAELSRLETGEPALQRTPFELGNWLNTAVEAHRPAFTQRGVRLVVKVPPGLPVVVADRRRLDQVLGNLLDNALEVSPTGAVVSLTARVEADETPAALTASFTVVDEGPGIPPDQLDLIFEPFHQIPKHGARGTGLGLSLVDQIVRLHSGQITVESTVGRGSRFTVLLPVRSAG